MKINQYPKAKSGYIAITTVIVIALVVLVISVTVTTLSINEGQSALALTKSEDTLTFVEGCGEDALLKLRSNNSYTGGTITRPEGTCNITVSGSSSPWTITATTAATDYKKTLTIIVTKTGNQLNITSRKEN